MIARGLRIALLVVLVDPQNDLVVVYLTNHGFPPSIDGLSAWYADTGMLEVFTMIGTALATARDG